ncbi:hypothetical protein PYW07_010062 [Mythimna separata]|uniref:Peptidase S1 domain-containing protein n=1 Tax=Mythimna separata TaxID=271217 RepID=A0AAD8DR85_MYTSE|nr:hypothetical protein PYW07_010062 [Mythimna separata]
MLKCFYILIWIAVFKLCFCQPSMGLGNESILGKKYLVYFVKSAYSEVENDGWLCAGAIVSPSQILTAAACLVEVDRIYAIAGSKKYINGRDIEKDKCANTWKKKVVKISVPKEYATSTAKEVEWMNVDIGVATVHEPYKFNDESYLTHCSYAPNNIKINFDKYNEQENVRAIALGWGGKQVKNIKVIEKAEGKPKLLQEATTTIIKKTFCSKLKNGSTELVNQYLLCASGNGFLGENDDESISNSTYEEQPTDATKNMNESNEMSSRKSTLLVTCQNDHGGPLTTWIGAEEVILGVALNGICNPNFDCVGPRIYVSTAATAKIIKCLLETNETKRKICNDQIVDKRYQVTDVEIKWPEDLKNNLSLNTQQGTPKKRFRRQRNEEELLQERPSENLRNFDGPEFPQVDHSNNPLVYPQEKTPDNLLYNQQYQPEENPLKNQPENRELNSYDQQQQQQSSQVGQTEASINEESNNQPVKPLEGYMNQPQMESQNQPEINAFNQPQTETQNQPKIDGYNQAPIDSYNQPPLDSYYNQPPIDATYNQPPMNPTYNQPLGTSNNNQPQSIQSNYKPQMEAYNQPQTGLGNQPQMGLSNQPDTNMASQNQPQQQINTDQSINNNPQIPISSPPQMEQYMPSQEQLYIQPQLGSYKKPLNSFLKLPTPFKKPIVEMYEAETFKKFESELLQPPPLKLESLRQTQYSNKEPQSLYGQKESFNPVTTESYNPLDIIMAENDPEEEFTFKPVTEERYKPPPVGLHKEPNVKPSMSQPFNPGLNKQFEQPLLNKKNQPRSPQPLGQPLEQGQAPSFDPRYNQPLRQRLEQTPAPSLDPYHKQPLGQPLEQAPAPSFDLHQDQPIGQPLEPAPAPSFNPSPSALRSGGPRNPVLTPSQGNSQTFENMFSELHAGAEAPDPPPPSKEETFDDLFRSLHEESRDTKFETRMDQPIYQAPGQPETGIANGPQDGIQLRQQAPLEFPDYASKRKSS